MSRWRNVKTNGRFRQLPAWERRKKVLRWSLGKTKKPLGVIWSQKCKRLERLSEALIQAKKLNKTVKPCDLEMNLFLNRKNITLEQVKLLMKNLNLKSYKDTLKYYQYKDGSYEI